MVRAQPTTVNRKRGEFMQNYYFEEKNHVLAFAINDNRSRTTNILLLYAVREHCYGFKRIKCTMLDNSNY